MNVKQLGTEFVTVFAIALGTSVIVTLLWNFIGHGEIAIDWETSFLFAVLFGIIQLRIKSREIKQK